MKVLVSGSRTWSNPGRIVRVLEAVHAKHPGPHTLIHGGAYGADHIAAAVAARLGWKVITVTPDWKQFKRAAGPIRNVAMLDMEPDLVIAFQEDTTPGTRHMIDIAMRRKITRPNMDVRIIRP